MSTDESYLDSLLNGLNSDNNNSNDRLSAFKKKAESVSTDNKDFEGVKDIVADETKDISDTEIENIFEENIQNNPEDDDSNLFQNFFFSEDEENDEVKDKASHTPETENNELFDADNNEPETLSLVDTAGEIEKYNIFDEYDDETIDQMINEELSVAENTGEPFVVSGNNTDEIVDKMIDKEISESSEDSEQFKITSDDQNYDIFDKPEPEVEQYGNLSFPESILTDDSEKEDSALESLLASQVADLDAEEMESAYEDRIFGGVGNETPKSNIHENFGINSDINSGAGSDTNTDTDFDNNSEADSNTEPDKNFEAGSDSEPDSNAETVMNSEAGSDLNSDSEEKEDKDFPENDIFSFLNAEETEEQSTQNENEDSHNAPEFADSEDIFAIRDEEHEKGLFDEDANDLSVNDLFDTESSENTGNAENTENSENKDNTDNKDTTDNTDAINGLSDSDNRESGEDSSDDTESSLLGLDSLFGPEPEESEEKRSASDYLKGDALDTLDESDIAALDDLFNEIDVTTAGDEEKEEKPKNVKKDKVPWYIKIFGNVNIPEEKIKPEPTEEELAKQKEEAAAAKKALAEAKKAEKEEKKKAAAEAKAIKQRQSAEEKEAQRKKKLEEASNLILEDTGNTKKLNKWGVIVIFCLFMGVTLLVISGGNTVAYNIGIRQATKYFDNALVYGDVSYYTKAYDKIYGLDIEEEDYEIYDKILTVNYVNTQLTAYTSHAEMDDYVAGLNDLFKGLLRFRKWFAHATAIGAQDDIYLVRTEIYNKLWEIYGIDEDEAMFVLEHYDYLKETYSENEANVYYTRYIYEKVEKLGLGTGSTN